MRAGTLRHLINFVKNNLVASDRGLKVGSTCNVYTDIPASVVTLQGREAEIQHEIVPTATHVVKCRYLDGITEDMNIQWGCRTLGIGAIIVGDGGDNRKKNMQFTCTEIKL